MSEQYNGKTVRKRQGHLPIERGRSGLPILKTGKSIDGREERARSTVSNWRGSL
jgi:hypothetical protein